MTINLNVLSSLSVQGKWIGSSNWNTVVDPLNGDSFIKVAEVDETEIQPFVESLSSCPKHGLHNPFKAPERYLMLGDVSTKAAHMLSLPKVSDFFTRLIQRVSPKSYQQAEGEVYVTRKFLENFCGDQSLLHFNKSSAGSIPGKVFCSTWKSSWTAKSWFSLAIWSEIPVLQLMGALYMGNKPVLKVDSKVSIVMEQMLRLLHTCGLPAEDVDFINSDGKTMNKLLLEVGCLGNPRMTLFTGSSRVAEKLAGDLRGRIKLEDAGFDWKILGPDVNQENYIAWVCDQDAYACSGQKCSAQSLLFMHENWSNTSFISKLKDLAERRKLADLTIGPVLTFTTDSLLEHTNKLLEIPGSKLLFGGQPLEDHSIPPIYGAIKPTAVYVPLEEIMKEKNYELVTKEIFGPFQVITDYKSSQLSTVLDAVEKMHAHLTAAVVSNDPLFLQEVIGKSVNGTTYAGLRARTTGAPQNHWFGPAGDPRGAGIGTPEAIKLRYVGIP
ncbi:Aldehyde/histidinol dehydrogenase [Sesbania bispinosa]|nr:Aldehyde/histidinol dehydrogenase [Sesbania bispinosa]